MVETIDFLTLRNEFKKIKGMYPIESYKYIHTKTVDHFLFHADSFNLNQHRAEVFNTLTDYFQEVRSTNVMDIAGSLQLFNKYIKPISRLYIDTRDFHLAIKTWVICLWVLPFFILVYLIKGSFYFYIALSILTIFLFVRNLYYRSRKKTYGFMH
jgi:hypothetical protein